MRRVKITALAGGTGSVKLVRGLYTLDADLTAVVNVGDNLWMHGLYVCPDIDTIVYGLAGVLDRARGWGLRGDTFNFHRQIRKIGAQTWFHLGDKDLATHVWRTLRLKEGVTLSQITAEMCDRFGVVADVIPATNQHMETRILVDSKELHLQEFWVKRRGRDTVKGVRYSCSKKGKPTSGAVDAIASSDFVVVCPGNPITSIGSILAIPGVRRALRRTPAEVLAVSPIIGRRPVSGPAGKLLRALNIEVSPVGVANLYRTFVDQMVIDFSDRGSVKRISELGLRPRFTNILMRSAEDEIRLAKFLVTGS